MRAYLLVVAVLMWGCGDDDGGDGGRADSAQCAAERCNGVDDDCDGVIDDDFDFINDETNCGACGVNCRVPNGSGVCEASSCRSRVLACDPFFGDCDADGTNGCEGDLLSNEHCGACNEVCMRTNGNASCAGGTCELLGCREGFGNCDENEANGCEVDLKTSVDHCGDCAMACAFENAAATCAESACAMGACDDGFGDCDDDASNGCETTLDTAENCGMCGVACNAGDTCVAGECVPVA